MVATAALLLGTGCFREAVKEAAQGTMQAMVEPTSESKEGKGQGEQQATAAGRSRTGAGTAQPDSIVGGAIEGSVTALDKELGTVQRVTRGTAAAAVGGAMTGALQEREELVELVAESAGAAGRAFAREAVAELTAPLPAGTAGEGMGEGMGEGQGQPGGAIALLARQGAAAAVGGAAEGLQAALTACPSGDANCAYGVLQQASRAIALGATEGVERAVDVWHIILAFLGGVVLAGLFALLFRAAMGRRPPSGSEGTGGPTRGFFGGLRGPHGPREAVAGASARAVSARTGALALHRHAATRTVRIGRRPRVQRPMIASQARG